MGNENGAVNIKCGDMELLSAGTFITYNDKPTLMQFSLGEDNGSLQLTFIDDKNIKETKAEYTLLKPDLLEIKMINYNNPLGHYMKSVAKLGALNNRELFYILRINPFPDCTVKEVVYSFYVGPEVANG